MFQIPMKFMLKLYVSAWLFLPLIYPYKLQKITRIQSCLCRSFGAYNRCSYVISDDFVHGWHPTIWAQTFALIWLYVHHLTIQEQACAPCFSDNNNNNNNNNNVHH